MDSTEAAEAANGKLVAEGCRFLVESNQKALKAGAYCEVVVRQVFQGGTIIDSFETVTNRKRPCQ